MDISGDVLRHCAGLGFAACRWPAMREYVDGIFDALRAAAPDNPAWMIGRGLQLVEAGDPDGARKLMMEHGVSADSGDPMARAFLGIFLVLGKRTAQAETVMQAVIADGSDPDAVKLAQSGLDNGIYHKHASGGGGR